MSEPRPSETAVLADDLERQLVHWLAAARNFLDAESFASRDAWASLEASTGIPLRRELGKTADGLIRSGSTGLELVRSSRLDPSRLPEAQRAVQRFRRLYLQVETTLDFFGQAVNSRTSAPLRATMQNLDRLARQSIEASLKPLGIPVPEVLTYIGDGLGASIIRAGIRLWAPGSVNPVAAIKIVRHNLYRPTSLFHETGHQVGHLTGWNNSLAKALGQSLQDDPPLKAMWMPWASEVAADVYAFCLTGYASVAALYDVVADERTMLRWPLGDPHPVAWLRTLLGCAMARQAYGVTGPWQQLESAVVAAHPVTRAEAATQPLLLRSRSRIDQLARTCLDHRVPGMRNQPVTALIDPGRVSPAALAELEATAGPALWTSPHLRTTEGIRIVALAGFREAERPDRVGVWTERALTWMSSGLRVA